MPPRAILFDWDGTLVAGAPPLADPCAAGAAALTAAGCAAEVSALRAALEAAIPPYSPGRTATVEPFPASLQRALGALGLAASAAAREGCVAAFYAAFVSGDRVYDDARALLASLRYRGYLTAVVTNTNFPAAFVSGHLSRLGIAGYVDAVVCSADVGLGKPHPAIYRHALARLGVAAEEALFVGDRPETDIAGAEAAGLSAVLLDRDGRHHAARCVRVAHLAALNGILGEGLAAAPRAPAIL